MTDRHRRSAIESKRGFEAHRRRGMRSRLKTTPFDVADYLDTPEAINEYLRLAAEDGNIELLRHAQETAARARAKIEKRP